MTTVIRMMLLLVLPGIAAHAQDATTHTTQTGTEAAITQMARDYEAAFNKADADALGAMFAEDIEYTDEDGALTTGRDDIVALLKKNFVANPGAKMEIDVQSVRAVTPDVAIERGATTTISRNGDRDSSAYTAVHVLKDGRWHIKQLTESPVPSPAPGEMLSDLGWMVGTWSERDGDAQIETKVNWASGGNFLTRNFKVSVGDDVTMQGWQIIGWDPAKKSIRSWLFDTEGGFQEGTWTHSGNNWEIRQTGYVPDGGVISSVSLFQREGEDKCVWESTSRTLDGDPQPSLPRIEISRVK